MSIIIEFFQIGVFNFIVFLVITFVGKLFSPLFFNNKKDKVFFNFLNEVLVGLILIIFLYSIIVSGFKTINLIGLILIVSYVILNLKNITWTWNFSLNKDNLKVVLSSLFFILVTTLISYLYPYKGQIDEDIVQYVNISRELNFSGIENIFTYFNSFKSIGLMPYHYFEMWFGSILFKLNFFNFSDAVVFRYCSYSILKSICLLGFLAFVELIKKIKIYDIFIVVFLFLFNSLLFTSIINDSYPLHTSVWLRPNLITYYLFLFPVFILFRYGYRKLSILFLFLIVIASTVTAPSVIPTFFTISILGYFFNKKNKSHAFKLSLLILFFSISVLFFYKIFGHSSEEVSKISSLADLYTYTLSIWKAIIFYLLTIPLRTIGIIFPSLILLLFYKQDFLHILRKNLVPISFSILLFVFGLLFFQLTTFMDNTYQFVYIGYCSLTIITYLFLYQLILLTFKKPINYKSSIVLFVLFFLNLWHVSKDFNFNIFHKNLAELNLSRQGLSQKYIYEIDKYMSEKNSLKGAFAFGIDTSYNYTNNSHENPHSTSQFGSYTYYLKSNLKLFPLSDPAKLFYGLDENSFFYRRYKVLTRLLPFYNKNNNLNYNERLKYNIDKEKINFIIVDSNFNMDNLRGICIDDIFVDLNKGHQFVIFCD